MLSGDEFYDDEVTSGPIDHELLRPWVCNLCGMALLLGEVGPHYRQEHPEQAPRVTPRVP